MVSSKMWVWCQDTSDPGHFGPKTFRHYQIGAEVSEQFGTSAEVSFVRITISFSYLLTEANS